MKQPLVVGYKGEIGSFILNGLLRVMPKALDIWCVDINETVEEVEERIKKSDIIFLCVPLATTGPWLLKYKELLKGKLIIEQCSLKQWLYEIIELKDLNITSMHILYRPSQTPNVEDRKIAFFKGQLELDLIKKISDMLQSKVVFYEDSQDHDFGMGIQQALTHRILLILGKLLKENNGSTYISKKVIELSERIQKGNKSLYEAIQRNRYLPNVLEEFQGKLEDFSMDDFWE
jgi:prephenate dehydrogenase